MAWQCLATFSPSRAEREPTLRTDTVGFSNLDANRITRYRKYQNTIEGDYQFNPRYSIHFGYRYGSATSKKSLKDSISAPTGQ